MRGPMASSFEVELGAGRAGRGMVDSKYSAISFPLIVRNSILVATSALQIRLFSLCDCLDLSGDTEPFLSHC